MSTYITATGRPIVAVDVETTGTEVGWHEIVQIAIVPVDEQLTVCGSVFYQDIKPQFPERAVAEAMEVNGLDLDKLENCPDSDQVARWMDDYITRLGGAVTPLAHNWSFESSFLSAWLGSDHKDQLFRPDARDGYLLSLQINDLAARLGKKPCYERGSLSWLADYFDIEANNAHDALADCYTEIAVYRRLVSDLENLLFLQVPQ